ncbi:hypothetical protein QR685DRAFT_598071 [Neurospora intermedia]|uniref:Uncharacterized protein n=1 Tax=Neurospora intermedia TaxID=5142 RepID=A0ABR3DAD8_NEUIN
MEIIALYGLFRATYFEMISTQIEAYKMERHHMVGDAQSPKIDQGPTSMLQCPKPAGAARPAIRKSCQKRSPHQDYRFHSFLVVVEF